jgi:fatty acyl-CoA reductase
MYELFRSTPSHTVSFFLSDITIQVSNRENKMTKNEQNSVISMFFDAKSVFITGATGFVGKQILEKLLRSCPG